MILRYTVGACAIMLLCIAFILGACTNKAGEVLNSDSVSTPEEKPLIEVEATATSNMNFSSPDLSQIPHYPNSQGYQLSSSSSLSSSLSFYTTDDYLHVQDFYSRTLIERGWRMVGTTSDASLMSLVWDDISRARETNYEIIVVINEAGDLQQHVQVYMYAWPTEYSVPFMPGAQSVETQVLTQTESIEKTTTYLIAAEAPEIEEFYKQNMQKNGWQLDPLSKSIKTEFGLLFVSIRAPRLTYSFEGGYTRITAVQLPDEQLQVTTHTRLTR